MVAVKVTDWPTVDGFADEVSVPTVVCFKTGCTSVVNLALKAPSPAYKAEIGREPAARSDTVRVARPDASSVTSVRLIPSIENVTEPVGVPLPPDGAEMVAVKVTD